MQNKIYEDPLEADISSEDMQRELNNLKTYLQDDDINISDKVLNQLDIFTRQLLKWNSVVNLTAIKELPQIMTKHYYDSLSPINRLNIKPNSSLIDIGTGAGFPGIPLKIMRPDIYLTLLDSLQKRLTFLEKAVKILKLQNVKMLHSRAEEASLDRRFREKYDYAVARAVAPLSTLTEYCLPYVKVGGSFFAYKGQKAKDEISQSQNAIKILGGEIVNVIEIKIPDEESLREVIEIKKISQTPTLYPRKSVLMTKKPL